MSEAPHAPFVRTVFHPTDFSEGSEAAFAHALAISLLRKSSLTILHAGRDYLADDQWDSFPPVRETLARWGLMEKDTRAEKVFDKLGVRLKKVNVKGLTPFRATLDYLDEHATDLIVLATGGREGLPRWIRPSVAERLARRSATATLFVPSGTRGFVSLSDGELTLGRILIPIDRDPSPMAPIEYAARAAAAMGDGQVEGTLLHVKGGGDPPKIELLDSPTCAWRKEERTGHVVDAILASAEEHEVNLIAMATEGHDGILDALRGSVTEQVVRGAPCPVLAVPA